MNSVRRSVLRSAASAARASVSSAQPAVSSLAAPAVRAAAQASRTNLAAVAAARAARYFSYSIRVANAEESTGSAAAAAETAAAGAGAGAGADASPEAYKPDDSKGETPYGVYVRNVVFDASEEHLKEAFEHYGKVATTAIARDARGLSRGYAFVFFETEEAQQKAISDANGSFWHGRRIVVQPRTGRSPTQNRSTPERDPTTSLYIGNLPYETTDADLNDLFRGLEGVFAVRVAVDRTTGWPRGFAHCDFNTVEQAMAAKEALNGRVLGTRSLRLDYAEPSRAPKRGQNNQNGPRSPSQAPSQAPNQSADQ